MSKELSVTSALKLGIEAHKSGRVQDADRYYSAVLEVEPDHPDANHNMGVLAVGIGKIEQALLFFERALKSNPKIEQYWLSQIDALIRLERFNDANVELVRAREIGVKGDSFAQLERRLNSSASSIKSVPAGLDPPQEILRPLLVFYQTGQMQQALTEIIGLQDQFPNSPILYNIRGSI